MEATTSLKNLSQSEKDFLLSFREPIPRLLLSKQEIKTANAFVKRGLMEKGTTGEACFSKGRRMYYTDSSIWSKL